MSTQCTTSTNALNSNGFALNTSHNSHSIPVLIAGAGACGLTAALAAHNSGAEVLVLERDSTPFGSTGMSYGAICAAGTRLQRDAGIDDSAEHLAEDIMTVTGGQTSESLARLIATNAGTAVDWLIDDLGFDLTMEANWTGFGHRQPRLHATPGRSGEQLMGMLLQACESAGITILTQARVTELLPASENSIRAVQIERPDGAIETVNCDALILATCGFGANAKWVSQHIPELANARYFGHEGNDGACIELACNLGASVADMGAYQSLGSLADPHSLVIPHTLMISGGVQINNNGVRFENELHDISGQALTILDQPDGICWIVYDEQRHQNALASFNDYQSATALGAPLTAASWPELAALMKVEADEFTRTMDEVANLCSTSHADHFGRTFSPSDALSPPYYTIRVTGALFHTQGGLIVDNDARVVQNNGTSFTNLFAGGGAARSVSGPGGWGYLPGMGLCTAVTLGYLAGKNAAAAVG
jgi:fumarate reductase flavoprotein subunit